MSETITFTQPQVQTTTAGVDTAAAERDGMLRLPQPLQLPLTFLTGKPYTGQRPVSLSPTFHLLTGLASITIGVIVSAAAWATGGWALSALLLGWAMTLHGMRNLRMMIYHQCAHRNMYNSRQWDAVLGRIIAALLVVQNFERYSKEHVSDHHAVHHMTLRDPTVQAFLISLDLHPGMTRRQMWHRVLGKLLSPRFHLSFALARVRSMLHGSSRQEKLVAAVGYGGVLAVCAATGNLIGFALVWLVPLVPVFQISNTLRLCVKHTFPQPGTGERRGKAYFGSLTNAIFLGEAVPAPGAPLTAWLRWTARMAFVHFPSRYLVLTGDTVCHDYHHRYPSSRQWFDYIFARQQNIEDGHRGWPPYHAVWGLRNAINIVFDSLSTADPEEFDVGHIRAVRACLRSVIATR